jgi:PPOX class probable F420-dependent enzyme
MSVIWPTDFETLLDSPSPAVLTTYRKDSTASVSPVWFRFHDRRFEVVIAERDVKLWHLRRRPECSLIVFETVAPFRGVRVEGPPRLIPDQDNRVRSAIAGRYLGAEEGRRFVEKREKPGVVLQFDATEAYPWDLAGILPDS